MYAKWAATAPLLVPPPVTFTMTSGVRLTVREICSICAGLNRARHLRTRATVTHHVEPSAVHRTSRRTTRLVNAALPGDQRRSGELMHTPLYVRYENPRMAELLL